MYVKVSYGKKYQRIVKDAEKNSHDSSCIKPKLKIVSYKVIVKP